MVSKKKAQLFSFFSDGKNTVKQWFSKCGMGDQQKEKKKKKEE